MSEHLYRYHLVKKTASGYTYIDTMEVQAPPKATIRIIEDAARSAVIDQQHDQSSTANIELAMYEPREPLGDTGMTARMLKEKFKELFDDNYQSTCNQLSTVELLGSIELREHLVVVFWTALEFRFLLFNCHRYFGSHIVTVEASKTIEAVEEAAQMYILRGSRPNIQVHTIGIVEPRKSLLEEFRQKSLQLEQYDPAADSGLGKVIQHTTNTPLLQVVTRDSLIIEFEFHYYSVLFEKIGPSYRLPELFMAMISPDDTVEAITDGAKKSFPGFYQHEHFKAYQLREKALDFETKTPEEIHAEIPLNDSDYRTKNLLPCIPYGPLKSLKGSVIIIFDNPAEEDHKALYPIREELGFSREKILEATRKQKLPSEDAKPAELQITQVSTRPDAVRNGRPAHLVSHPIQIYHPVFAKFLSQAFLPFDGDEDTLQKTLEFIYASRRCYEDKGARIPALRSSLSYLVHPDILLPRVIKADIDGREQFAPDGTILADCLSVSTRPVCAFVEVRNEFGTGRCDPGLQCQSDFVKLCSASTYRPIVDASCCPVFLLAISGPRLMVGGAVFANEFIAQEFTDYLTLGSHPTDFDGGVRRIAQVLVTLRECIQDLDSFYGDLKYIRKEPAVNLAPVRKSGVPRLQSIDLIPQYIPENPLGRWVPPYHTKFEVGDTRYSLTYERPLESEGTTTRGPFMASMKSSSGGADKLVVVKFTRVYCPEAHALLAKMSLAPKLFYHECIAGVHFVVMEHLNATEVTDDQLVGERGAEHIESLRRAVKALHDKELVFGDLRSPNILIAEDGLKLVDFDWTGKQGRVCYPVDISSKIPWPEGVFGGGKIKAEHDKEWFRRLASTEL